VEPQTGIVPVNDEKFVKDPMSPRRLVSRKLMQKDGRLTEYGWETVKSMKKMLKRLESGVPFASRTISNSNAIFDSNLPWYCVPIRQTMRATLNGEIVFKGMPHKKMTITESSASLKREAKAYIQKTCRLTEGYMPAKPQIWQAKGVDILDVIWLVSRSKKIMVSVQTKYFDFLMSKYPKGEWWIKSSADVIQVRTRKDGAGMFNQVMAIVCPILTKGALTPPKMEGLY
jgi:hypothetical protein